MYKLYKTNSIEETIRLFSQEKDASLVFEYFQNYSRIRARLDRVPDVPIKLANPRFPFYTPIIEPGVTLYRHNTSTAKLIPRSSCVLFIEMPHSLAKLHTFSKNVSEYGEVVIYRPPDWSQFIETIQTKYPSDLVYELVKGGIRKYIADPHPYLHNTGGQTPDFDACFFTAEELAGDLNLSKKMVERSLYLGFKGAYIKYFPYRLGCPPTDPALFGAWDVLRAQKNDGGSFRVLRSDELDVVFTPGGIKNRLVDFKKHLRMLVKQKSIIKYRPVYAFNKACIEDDLKASIYSKKRAALDEMFDLVDAAPNY